MPSFLHHWVWRLNSSREGQVDGERRVLWRFFARWPLGSRSNQGLAQQFSLFYFFKYPAFFQGMALVTCSPKPLGFLCCAKSMIILCLPQLLLKRSSPHWSQEKKRYLFSPLYSFLSGVSFLLINGETVVQRGMYLTGRGITWREIIYVVRCPQRKGWNPRVGK